MWRITRAAAMIFPIFHGQRLTLRRALSVVLSREFPRSRRPLAVVRLVVGFLLVGELSTFGFF